MTALDLPGDAAEKLRRLRRVGFSAKTVPVSTWPLGLLCRACPSSQRHAANVVVNVIFNTVEYHEPAWRLSGWSTPCCWAQLATYLDEAEHEECFLGVEIEVPHEGR